MVTDDICFDIRTGEIICIGQNAYPRSRDDNMAMIGFSADAGYDWSRALDPNECAYRLKIRKEILSRHPSGQRILRRGQRCNKTRRRK